MTKKSDLVLSTIFAIVFCLGCGGSEPAAEIGEPTSRDRELFVLKTILAGYGCMPEALAVSGARISDGIEVPSEDRQLRWWKEIQRREAELIRPVQLKVVDPSSRVRHYRQLLGCPPTDGDLIEMGRDREELERAIEDEELAV